MSDPQTTTTPVDPLEETRRRLEEQRRQAIADGQSNALIDIFDAFLSFFAALLGFDENSGPDFEDANTPEEAERARREYEGGRSAREREQFPDLREGARANFNPVNVAQYSQQLLALRQRAEQENGGRPVEAIIPVLGNITITSHYGHRHAPTRGASTNHHGLDIAPTAGGNPAIIAPVHGVVVGVGRLGSYGNVVEIIDIYGVRHRFAHLDSAAVQVGQMVEQGQQIGVMGTTGRSTGVHLHYEQRDRGDNTRDPRMLGRDDWERGQSIGSGLADALRSAGVNDGDLLRGLRNGSVSNAELQSAVDAARRAGIAIRDTDLDFNNDGAVNTLDAQILAVTIRTSRSAREQ